MKIEPSEAPVPIEVHHEVLRFVEAAVREELRKVSHPWLPVGTRVVYTLANQSTLPSGQEYRLECGYLDPLNNSEAVEVDDYEWEAINQQEVDPDPLPLAFIDALHNSVRQKLEAAAHQPLLVGYAGVLIGSEPCPYGVGCWCAGSRKGYYRRCRLNCLQTGC